jgi:hypothetical protein
MSVANASLHGRTLADPIAAYESVKDLWIRSRAVCGGERFVKDYDSTLDKINFSNFLIPFSPSMTDAQYKFYKAEAELPGIVSQYAHIIVGGLLRKQPVLVLPKDAPDGAQQWIMDSFAQDSSPITSFLDRALWEEVQTSRAWVYIDYPRIQDESLQKEDFLKIKPYPVLWSAESIINWSVSESSVDGTQILNRIIIRNFVEEINPQNEFHPKYMDTVWVHELNSEGYYQIRKFQKPTEDSSVPVVSGKIQQNYSVGGSGASNISGQSNPGSGFQLIETIENILSNGERLRQIPAWPLNGSINIVEPILIPLIDREVHLYNKLSRRNHLLYGAATYTPVISSDMADEAFDEIVGSGLGSWIKLRQGDSASVLETPTAALADMDRSIASTIEEMAKMGLRMLSPETAQSGVALEIRNASQTAQLGTLNTKISNQMADIIAFMINWRYGTEYTSLDVQFTLAANFDSIAVNSDWMRLISEWYQAGLIPRSTWLQIAKSSEIVPTDYDDVEGREEITKDAELLASTQSGNNMDYASQTQPITQDETTNVESSSQTSNDSLIDPTTLSPEELDNYIINLQNYASQNK